MKLIKAIKLHWKLRIKQEYACNKVCEYSQIIPHPRDTSPYLSELCSLNKAVSKVESFIPDLYFFLSDLFGGATRLKKQSKAYYIKKENEELEILKQWYKKLIESLVCYDLVADPGFSSN